MKDGEDLVSVILPTYNREKELFRAVESVLQQTHQNIELVIVDDSKESCLDKLTKLMGNQKGRELNYIHNNKPRGSPMARNMGFRKSEGCFIAFLDDDDTWHPDKLKKQMEIFSEHPDCPLVSCGSLDLRFGRKYEDYPPQVADRKDILNAFNYSSTSTYLIKRYALDIVDGFDITFKSAQEYELAIRLTKFHKARSVPEILVTQYPSSGQISENWKNKRIGISQVYQEHKQAFLQANWMNGFKVLGIISMFYLAQVIGSKRVYWILQKFKRKHAEGKAKILFLYKHDRSFVNQDYDLLAKNYDVIKYRYTGLGSLPGLINNFRKVDMIFVWFASYHAFIPAFLTKKPLIVVTGGYDVAGDKTLKYGLMLSPIWKRMAKYILHSATAIISVSEFNQSEVRKHCNLDSNLIYNCVDSEKFKPGGKKDRNVILTVGAVTKENWVRKGLSKFMTVAQHFGLDNKPGKFIVVGAISEDMEAKIRHVEKKTPNLTFTGFISDEKLLRYYQQAKVYCQLSYYESFGMSPAEAMLCNCIPVVSDRTALPEVVGHHGYIVNYHDITNILTGIKEAQSMETTHIYREWIIANFSPEEREKKLCEVIEAIIDGYKINV